jgi:hypothetical protein
MCIYDAEVRRRVLMVEICTLAACVELWDMFGKFWCFTLVGKVDNTTFVIQCWLLHWRSIGHATV